MIGFLTTAVETILSEPRFQFDTPAARRAFKLATIFLEASMDKRKESIVNFARMLEKELKTCFITTHRTNNLKQEKMWGEYHKLRTSEGFATKWQSFLNNLDATEVTPCAAFIQHITHEVFKKIIQVEHPKPMTTIQSLPPLTDMESNALRYVAGYVCRTLHDSLKSSRVEGKEAMVLYLSDLNGSDRSGDGEEWINTINRGGLWQVNDDVFETFVIIEEIVREELRLEKCMYDTKKAQVIEKVVTNEDVLHQWSFCMLDADEHISNAILQRVVELYIRIRGFAFASSCIELYKQSSKKALSKKKALRTQLNLS